MLEGEADELMPDTEAPLALDELADDAAPEADVPADDAPDDDDDSDEITVAFEGEEPIAATAAAPDSSVIREMRKRNREMAAELARLKAQSDAAPVVPVVEQLGPMPTLESCDWDEQKLAEAITARERRAIEIERARVVREEAAAKQAAADAAEAAEYVKSWSRFDASAREDAEAAFIEAVPNTAFQRLIVRAADNPAALMLALSRSPARLAELAAITDAAKMAAAVGKLEARLKVTKVSKVQPEKRVSGGAPLSTGGEDRYLAKLEAEAARTGDRTKIYQYKREQQRKAVGR